MSCRVAVVIFGAFLALRGETGSVSARDAETSLVSELAGNIDASRLADIEAELRPMFTAMPKHDGNLGHQAVRYLLHRLFVERHSWYVTGLEPGDDDKPLYLEGEWVPRYLQNMLEERLGGRGMNLHELAALAAAVEDLVHKEAFGNLEKVYRMHHLPIEGLVLPHHVHELISTYMMFYLEGGKFSAPADLSSYKERFIASYADWKLVEAWFRDIVDIHLKKVTGDGLELSSMQRLVADLSEKFGFFNDRECRDLKGTMLEIRDGATGRVRLSDFYAKSLHSHWQFNEKADYLRAIGALDEVTDAQQPRVILPNYIMSRSNCLESSSLYSVCCRNECEDLMGKLEADIAQPTAPPARVVQLVQQLTSATVEAGRALPVTLLQRLDQIARSNSGTVPLHGRLFAQWMHHAFPLECPFPHEAGTASPQTPDEWMQEAADGHRASEEEMRSHIDLGDYETNADKDLAALHWSDADHMVFAHAVDGKRRRGTEGSPHALRRFAVVFGLLIALGCTLYVLRGSAEPLDQLPGSRMSRREIARRKTFIYTGVASLLFSLMVFADSVGLIDRRAFAITMGLAALSIASSAAMGRAHPSVNSKAKGFDLWEGEHEKLA